jgi:hypothetical protein
MIIDIFLGFRKRFRVKNLYIIVEIMLQKKRQNNLSLLKI